MTLPAWKWHGWKWPGLRRGSELDRVEDPWVVPPRVERVETPVVQLLSEIETAACAVYAHHGLPDRPGHYARSPRSRTWRFLSDDLTAEERFSVVLAQKDGSKWRFGSLPDLGDQEDSPPDLRRAAQVLRSCQRLRARLAETGLPSLGEDLETAIGLGAAWRQLDVRPALIIQRNDPLKLTIPSKPSARKAARSKRTRK
ncbi:hypothetical protein BH10PSE2_BH10PSE2_17040 [soil metagenome]